MVIWSVYVLIWLTGGRAKGALHTAKWVHYKIIESYLAEMVSQIWWTANGKPFYLEQSLVEMLLMANVDTFFTQTPAASQLWITLNPSLEVNVAINACLLQPEPIEALIRGTLVWMEGPDGGCRAEIWLCVWMLCFWRWSLFRLVYNDQFACFIEALHCKATKVHAQTIFRFKAFPPEWGVSVKQKLSDQSCLIWYHVWRMDY